MCDINVNNKIEQRINVHRVIIPLVHYTQLILFDENKIDSFSQIYFNHNDTYPIYEQERAQAQNDESHWDQRELHEYFHYLR